MAEHDTDTTDIKETDIVFDCPQCGKSLAIDYLGAGLTIQCSDCGSDVIVPIPDGMQVSDLDSTDEEQEMRIMNLRRSLSGAEVRIAELETEIEELRTRRESLEKHRSDNMQRVATIAEKADLINKAVKDIVSALEHIISATGNGTP